MRWNRLYVISKTLRNQLHEFCVRNVWKMGENCTTGLRILLPKFLFYAKFRVRHKTVFLMVVEEKLLSKLEIVILNLKSKGMLGFKLLVCAWGHRCPTHSAMGTSDSFQISAKTKIYGEAEIGTRPKCLRNFCPNSTAVMCKFNKLINWQDVSGKKEKRKNGKSHWIIFIYVQNVAAENENSIETTSVSH